MSTKRSGEQGPQRAEANLRVVHPHAAGIDIGSKRHYVAIPAECEGETVRSFGCLTPDLHELAKWLKQHQVDTVAMESTGVYWIPVAQVLDSYGIEVNLVDGRAAKGIPGRKSDVQDCQWLQELHTFGLLRGAFRPTQDMAVVRSYWRHRAELVKAAAEQIHLMQKSLELMNLQLHKVLSDVTGVTGMTIIRAIISGQRDPVVLAKMRHPQVKSSTETIVKALTGDWREEHLFTLQQAVETYDFFHGQMAACDQQIDGYMQRLPGKVEAKDVERHTGRHRRKNQVHFDLGRELHRITGVDLTRIDSIDVLTAQTVISECGYDVSRFPTERDFSSWLGVCPNHVITGGKVRRRRTRKVYNRAAQALHLAAQTLHHSKTALGAYYRRMKARLGPPKAITATAHKLACLIYRMLKFGMEYVDKGQEAYEKQYRERVLHSLKKHASQMGYAIVPIPVQPSVS
jgi:transposase